VSRAQGSHKPVTLSLRRATQRGRVAVQRDANVTGRLLPRSKCALQGSLDVAGPREGWVGSRAVQLQGNVNVTGRLLPRSKCGLQGNLDVAGPREGWGWVAGLCSYRVT
jgi:hypothetical protein